MHKPERHQAPAEEIAGASIVHDSASKHVSGEAVYIDDMPEPDSLAHAYFGLSGRAHARIVSLDLSGVRAAPGVLDVLTAADIPGANDISPVGRHDEPLLAAGAVHFAGQPVFAVAAKTRDAARRAVKLARVIYKDLPAAISLEAAEKSGALVTPGMRLARGDAKAALAKSPKRLNGVMAIGGQEHFYLEGHVALAVPGEDQDVTVYSSTQHPSEVQHMVSHVLAVPAHAVTVEVRRMGGGFGGKETQGNQFACIAAMFAKRLRRAVKIRPDRDDDMIITGKRHDFNVRYDAGFHADGRIEAVDAVFAARCGWSADLSGPVTDRALFHADNAYFYPHARLESLPLRSNTQSNTAFRGFGGPQGMLGAERVIEEIAFACGLDPLDVRKKNFYAPGSDITPYHQTLNEHRIARIVEELERSCDYRARKLALREANALSPVIKRGLALTPVKFGISFTFTPYNQAGALLHIYRDGSAHLNHGGTEMGQGLYIKVAQVVAETLNIDLDRVKITATTTAKVPNTSATAASSGADLNGKAAMAAALALKGRLAAFAAERWQVPPEQVVFMRNRVRAGNTEISFPDLVEAAYQGRVPLSATGFYKTPDIHWDRAAGRGNPFYYFACGAACTEAAVDTLTGETRIERVDILHDCGASLNPAIDLGQIEGGFVQGAGWLTSEELVWDDAGHLKTHAPATYKIPACGDRPRIFNIAMLRDASNTADTIFRSKAAGEPPLMLAISVLHAISDAVASVADYRFCPRLDAPATPERVLAAVERLKAG